MLKQPIFLNEFKPNGYGGSRHYKFFNGIYNPCSRQVALSHPELIRGWAMGITTYQFKKERLCLFLGDDDFFWVFYKDNYFKLFPDGLVIDGFSFWKRVIFFNAEHNKVLVVIKCFIPPLRYLANDGMFPNDVEPFLSLLIDIKLNYADMVLRVKELGLRMVKNSLVTNL